MNDSLAAQHFILLQIDNIQLCFPYQNNIVIDLVSEVKTSTAFNTLSVGNISHGAKKWPVYSIRKDFTFLPSIVDSHRFCVNFGTTIQQSFSLLCTEITNIKRINHIALEPVPACMHTSLSPINQIFMMDKKIVFMMDQDKLNQHIQKMDSDDDD